MTQPTHDWLGGICMAALIFVAIHLTQPEESPTTTAERTNPMKAQGLLFMSRTPPSLTRAASGEPQLLLRTVHRAGKHQTEAWTLTWVGQAASDFYVQNAHQLTAGQPLSVSINALRTHVVGQVAEILALVDTCALVPRVQHQPTQGATT